jgi:hypothetical protein
MIAHVGGVPLEEVLPALAGASTALAVARAWLTVRLRRDGFNDPTTPPARCPPGR